MKNKKQMTVAGLLRGSKFIGFWNKVLGEFMTILN
jgi:hypothetical protein